MLANLNDKKCAIALIKARIRMQMYTYFISCTIRQVGAKFVSLHCN